MQKVSGSNPLAPTIFFAVWTTYILFSPTLNRYYIGQTGDLPTRLRYHATGSTDFTARTSDWLLVFAEVFETEAQAVRLERRIKKAKSHRSIARYVANPRNTVRDPLPNTDW